MAFSPTLTQLRAFVLVADHGGFSRAAAELGVTQSSLSHNVSSLEQGLGVTLLRRHARGIQLTEVGQQVLGRARTILQLTEQLVQELGDSPRLQGVVKVACYRSVATHLFPGVVQRLALQHPGLRLDIHDGCLEREEPARLVLQGHCQLGLAHLPVDPRLQAFPVLRDPYVLVLPAQAREVQGWQDLQNLSYIRFGRQSSLDEEGWQHLSATLSLQEESSILAMVKQGLGFSILPRLATEPLPDGVKLQGLPDAAFRTLGVVVRPDTLLLPEVKAVLDVLCDPGVLVWATRQQGWNSDAL